MLERILVNDGYVAEVFNVVSQNGDVEDLSCECNEAFQNLETHFVNGVCGGSEQYAWDLIEAIAREATCGKPCDMILVTGIGHLAMTKSEDSFYIKYMGVLLSMYERINTDVLVPNYQYRMSDDTVANILQNYKELTTTYAAAMYLHAKDVFSGFINTAVIPVDKAVLKLYRYYKGDSYLTDEECLRQAFADGDHHKALVYFIKACRVNAHDTLNYIDGVKLNATN